MSIIQRGGSFQATVAHKGTRYRRQFGSESDAQVWELEAKASLIRGEAPSLGEQAKVEQGKPRTLGELLTYVDARHWRGQKSEVKSRANAEATVRLLGAHLPVKSVDAFAIDKVVLALRAVGNSNATINRKLSALSRMLSVALDLQIIPFKPKCERFRETEKRLYRFTPEVADKAAAFFERMGEQDMGYFVEMGLGTGARVGELLRLRWSETTGGAITVTETKSGKNRVIPLTLRLRGLLMDREAHRGNAVRVFEALDQGKVTRSWNKLRAHLGLLDEPSFVPHILRHEFCSRLADRGVNAAAIRDLAGHSSLIVTQRYINLSPVALGDAIRALEPA